MKLFLISDLALFFYARSFVCHFDYILEHPKELGSYCFYFFQAIKLHQDATNVKSRVNVFSTLAPRKFAMKLEKKNSNIYNLLFSVWEPYSELSGHPIVSHPARTTAREDKSGMIENLCVSLRWSAHGARRGIANWHMQKMLARRYRNKLRCARVSVIFRILVRCILFYSISLGNHIYFLMYSYFLPGHSYFVINIYHFGSATLDWL